MSGLGEPDRGLGQNAGERQEEYFQNRCRNCQIFVTVWHHINTVIGDNIESYSSPYPLIYGNV